MSVSPTKMPWGKYKGWAIDTVPTGYLAWCLANCDLTVGLMRAIQQSMKRRGAPCPTPYCCPLCDAPADWSIRGHNRDHVPPGRHEQARLVALIREVYRLLAKSFHPDRNPGNPEALGKFLGVAALKDGLLERLGAIEEKH